MYVVACINMCIRLECELLLRRIVCLWKECVIGESVCCSRLNCAFAGVSIVGSNVCCGQELMAGTCIVSSGVFN